MAKRRKNKKVAEEQIIDIVEVKDNASDWFESNKNLVLGGLALLILLVGGYIVYKYMIQEPKEKEAKAAIYKAELQFQRDSFALALENPGDGFEGLLDIIENYSGTKSANLAKLYSGIAYLNLGRHEDAISYLDAHKASGTYSPILKNGNLGDAHSELGNFDQAISYYEKAANSGEDALLTPYYLYKLGLLAKRNDKKSTAISALERIRDNYPDSEEARKVARLIAGLSNS